MKLMKVLVGILGLVVCSLFIHAQALQTGTIRGTVTDTDGQPIPGVNLLLTSPALMGSASAVTNDRGEYRMPALPPGTYSLVAELDGFQSVRRDNIIVRVGMVVSISMQMALAGIEKEILVVAPSPVVDVQSTKFTTIVTTEIMQQLPLNRNLSNIIAVTPGTIGSVMQGGVENSNAFEVDGVNVNDPAMHGRLFTVSHDTMEEIEIISGGLPAQVGLSSGSFVNVITKSGGNQFHGQFQLYYSNESMTKILYPDYQLRAMGVGKPAAPIFSYDSSLVLGGPIIKDKIWFFADLHTAKSESHSPFVPTTILGRPYDQYPLKETGLGGSVKVTTQLSEKMRFFVLAAYDWSDQPYSLWLQGARNTAESLIARTPERWAITGNLSWILGPNSILDFRGGWVDLKMPQPYSELETTRDNPHYNDAYTGYNWGSPFRQNEYVGRNTKQASVRLTHFVDNKLGGNHEIVAGIEYQDGTDHWDWWRGNPMHWRFYNGSPWYYRGVYGLSGPHPEFGDGYLWFGICGPNQGDTIVQGTSRRFSGYVQDSWSIKRLTLNLGMRFDTYSSFMPAATKAASAGIAPSIGQGVVEPVHGFNPFGELTLPEWSGIMGWSPLSPRIGLSYDLFGNGKTALKASYSRYAEALPVMYFLTVHPFRPRELAFYWWDLNNDGNPDPYGIDDYRVAGGANPAEMAESFYKQRIADDIKAPMHDEFTLSVHHELTANVKVALQLVHKTKKNIVDTVLWDPTTEEYWYTYEMAPEYWVPFTTTIPAYGDFPKQDVTLYMMSRSAPGWFTKFANVPEARRDYRAVQFTFEKRMSRGWMLGGSVAYSVTRGDNTGAHGDVWGYGSAYDTANYWVNRYGRDIRYDRPWAIKLFGSFELPWGLSSGFYFSHFSGTPWARTVEVFPPSAWAAENNTNTWSWAINVEAPGKRRNPSTNNLDFRLEKGFGLLFGRLSVFLDVYNLLGSTYLSVGQNPGGRWYPANASTETGTYNPDAWYGKITGLSASRTYKIAARFAF